MSVFNWSDDGMVVNISSYQHHNNISTVKSGFKSNPIFESNMFHQVQNNVECGMNGSSRRGSPAGPNDIVWNIN